MKGEYVMKKIAIGGGQGFWGDSPDAALHMLRHADIQYMACDYLAELTMSIMAKQQLKRSGQRICSGFRHKDSERRRQRSLGKRNPYSDECRWHEYHRLRGGYQTMGRFGRNERV